MMLKKSAVQTKMISQGSRSKGAGFSWRRYYANTVLFLVAFFGGGVVVAGAEGPVSMVAPASSLDCEAMRSSGVITDKNPVGCDRLSVVSFPYIDFQGGTQQGRIMVLDVFAESTLRIFMKLYEMKFPLDKAQLMDAYRGDDKASMEENNTSSFNGRPLTGGKSWSLHAYGAAIDINPVQNPYMLPRGDTIKVEPSTSAQYLNRKKFRATKKPPQLGLAEEVVDVFAENGFLVWGGYWNAPVDFQHFQVGSRSFVRGISDAPFDEGMRIFNDYIQQYRNCLDSSPHKNHEQARAVCVDQVAR